MIGAPGVAEIAEIAGEEEARFFSFFFQNKSVGGESFNYIGIIIPNQNNVVLLIWHTIGYGINCDLLFYK